MELKHDYSYISATENKLISAGYGEKTVYSLHFDRHFSDEEMAANVERAENMTTEEWNSLCDSFAKSINTSLTEIIACLADRYDIYQTTKEKSTRSHYNSDWDLFFWSNKGWNGKNYMDCFSLTFNERRSSAQNMNLLDEIITILENMDYKNIACRIQYSVSLDDEKMAEAAYNVFDGLIGKPFEYMGMTGKIKLVSECDGVRRYGFFKKGAKKHYYTITNTAILAEILAMNT